MKARGLTVRETVDAKKQRYEATQLEALLGDAKEIFVAKGKQTLRFSVNDSLDWGEVEAVALGRSGNLRAPTIRAGKRVLVGYADAAWGEFFGEP